MLEIEDGLVLLSHLLCQPVQPRICTFQWVALVVPFTFYHVLYIIVPHLLEQAVFPIGKVTHRGSLIRQDQYIEHEWCCRRLIEGTILFQGIAQGCKGLACLHQISIDMLMGKS